MRSLLLVSLSVAALALPSCTLIAVDGLQGDSGSFDGAVDASFDGAMADVPRADVPEDDAPRLDAPEDPDAGMPPEDTGMADAGRDAGRDAGTATVAVTGTVVGLPAGRTLRVGNGGMEMDVAGAAGSTSFTFRVPTGGAYAVSIVTAPSELLCVLYRGSGTASADVTNVFVGCSTAMDLVSWFPFDGSASPGRGTNWSSTSGALTYTADRLGRPGLALEVTTGTDYRIVRPLDGRTSSVAPRSSQFTVSAWVRVPSSAPTTEGSGVFGHAGPLALAAEMQVNWRSGMPYADLYFYWDGGAAMSITSHPAALVRDRWHHIVVAAAGPAGASGPMFDRTIYVDGVRGGTTSTCCGWSNDTSYWMLGAAHVQRDDLRLYSRMLSDAEVAGIYAAENVP